MDGYNRRPHSKLKESPLDRFLREKEHLRQIPKVEPTMLHNRTFKSVSSDGYISYNGGLYPVPMYLCLRDVMVESVFGRFIRVYDEGGSLVIEHPVNLFENGLRTHHPEHEEINRRYEERRVTRKSEVVSKFVDIFGDSGRTYIDGLRERAGANLYWHLREIIRYTEIYDIGEVSGVIQECINIGAYHKNSIKRLLSVRKMQKPAANPLLMARAFESVSIKRGLSDYRVEVPHE